MCCLDHYESSVYPKADGFVALAAPPKAGKYFIKYVREVEMEMIALATAELIVEPLDMKVHTCQSCAPNANSAPQCHSPDSDWMELADDFLELNSKSSSDSE